MASGQRYAPDPDIMLGTSVDALAWLAKMGGPKPA
jgi:hypothetical protein